jgi:F-type H+-transporting ATPase subunit delta
MQQVLASPGITREQVADLFVTVCADALDEGGRNFVRVLADNHRVGLLGEIAEQYATLRAEAKHSSRSSPRRSRSGSGATSG